MPRFNIETIKYLNYLARSDDFVTMSVAFNEVRAKTLKGLYEQFGVGEGHVGESGFTWATWKVGQIAIITFTNRQDYNKAIKEGYIK